MTKAARDRNLTEEEIKAAAEGRIWTGLQAKKMKLVDEIGGMDEAIEEAKLAAGFGKRQDIEIDIYPPQPGVLELIQQIFSGNIQVSYNSIASLCGISSIAEYAALLPAVRNNSAMALMPFVLQIK